MKVPRQRNSCEENERIKAGVLPAEWDEQPAIVKEDTAGNVRNEGRRVRIFETCFYDEIFRYPLMSLSLLV